MSARTEISRLNERIETALSGLPPPWEVPVAAARLTREEGRSIFGELRRSPRAVDETIETALGKVGIRVFRPLGDPVGTYVHVHGGGWVLGATHHQDPRLERLADDTRQTVVSVDYRLSPEHPYPAGPDDTEAATMAVIDSNKSRFGADHISLGGESAGAHLALVTALRLRDRHGFDDVRALNLLYGVFDLRLTPSARLYGSKPQVLNTDSLEWFIAQFASDADLEDPDVSPLLADLEGMPPAVFTVGTRDPLVDDTLFMHQRWVTAGIEAVIQVHDGAPHAFDAFDVSIAGQAHRFINAFLASHLPN
jgi:acetyl esterase